MQLLLRARITSVCGLPGSKLIEETNEPIHSTFLERMMEGIDGMASCVFFKLPGTL